MLSSCVHIGCIYRCEIVFLQGGFDSELNSDQLTHWRSVAV